MDPPDILNSYSWYSVAVAKGIKSFKKGMNEVKEVENDLSVILMLQFCLFITLKIIKEQILKSAIFYYICHAIISYKRLLTKWLT